jgi:hypothetical protein
MTAKELQKRGAKAEWLRVLQTEDGSFYAESAEGKILCRVILDDQETSCTCADFTRNFKKDPNFQCKHILSVLNCVPTGDVESVQYLDRKKPKLDERWVIEIENSQFVKYAGLLDLGHQKQDWGQIFDFDISFSFIAICQIKRSDPLLLISLYTQGLFSFSQ